MGTWELLGKPIDVVKVAVGLVLVLLVELGIVVGLVVEFTLGANRGDDGSAGGDRRNRGWKEQAQSFKFMSIAVYEVGDLPFSRNKGPSTALASWLRLV